MPCRAPCPQSVPHSASCADKAAARWHFLQVRSSSFGTHGDAAIVCTSPHACWQGLRMMGRHLPLRGRWRPCRAQDEGGADRPGGPRGQGARQGGPPCGIRRRCGSACWRCASSCSAACRSAQSHSTAHATPAVSLLYVLPAASRHLLAVGTSGNSHSMCARSAGVQLS